MKSMFHSNQTLEYIGHLAAVIISFMLPIASTLMLISLFLIADLITGIWKARKKGEIITSKRMSDTIAKIALFSLSVVCLHGLETQFSALGFIHITQIGSAYIAIVELKSILENVSEITGLDIWTHLKGKFVQFKNKDREYEQTHHNTDPDPDSSK